MELGVNREIHEAHENGRNSGRRPPELDSARRF